MASIIHLFSYLLVTSSVLTTSHTKLNRINAHLPGMGLSNGERETRKQAITKDYSKCCGSGHMGHFGRTKDEQAQKMMEGFLNGADQTMTRILDQALHFFLHRFTQV